MNTTSNFEGDHRSSQGAGPIAHEDLTIAEHIEEMRTGNEHRPNEVCLNFLAGDKKWISETNLMNFIRSHGAEHPSDYQAAYGKSWEEALFQS